MLGHPIYITIAVGVGAFVGGYFLVSFLLGFFGFVQREPHISSRVDGKQEDTAQSQDEPTDNTARQERNPSDSGCHSRQEDNTRYRSRAPYDGALEQTHLSSLGLTSTPTSAELKRTYRELIAKYHPDKVAHLGPEFAEFAEKRTREIVAAYHYFDNILSVK